MSRSTVRNASALALAGMFVLCDSANAQTSYRSVEQAPTVVAHSTDLSEREATLTLHLSDGETLAVSLSGGKVLFNRREIAGYVSGAHVERTWRGLLGQASEMGPNEILHSVLDWGTEELGEDAGETLSAGLVPLETLNGLRALEGLEALGGLEALEELATLEALDALKELDVEALQTEIRERLGAARSATAESPLAEIYVPETSGSVERSPLSQMAGDIAGLLAAFVAMCSLGFGLVFFAPRQLEVVADTVRHSFWRSFFAGLFAQPLIIPVFGLLMIGLALTVVGILVIPFAAVAFAAAAVLGILGGYLAVARSVGEAYLRRRMSLGHAVGGWLTYRYMVYGLLSLFAIWLPAAFFGWAPAAGQVFTVTAILISWIIATAGFGATVLSHAGIRGTFSRRFDQALSDEYLYRTPQATPVVPPHKSEGRIES